MKEVPTPFDQPGKQEKAAQEIAQKMSNLNGTWESHISLVTTARKLFNETNMRPRNREIATVTINAERSLAETKETLRWTHALLTNDDILPTVRKDLLDTVEDARKSGKIISEIAETPTKHLSPDEEIEQQVLGEGTTKDELVVRLADKNSQIALTEKRINTATNALMDLNLPTDDLRIIYDLVSAHADHQRHKADADWVQILTGEISTKQITQALDDRENQSSEESEEM